MTGEPEGIYAPGCGHYGPDVPVMVGESAVCRDCYEAIRGAQEAARECAKAGQEHILDLARRIATTRCCVWCGKGMPGAVADAPIRETCSDFCSEQVGAFVAAPVDVFPLDAGAAMTDPDWLTAWLALCDGATPGPWTTGDHPTSEDKVTGGDGEWLAHDLAGDDSRHIAACSPERIRWLLEMVAIVRANGRMDGVGTWNRRVDNGPPE